MVLRKHYQTPNDHRDIRGSKVVEVKEADFRLWFMDPAGRNMTWKKDPWTTLSDWYFDAALGKNERYQRQAYAHSRSKDPTGLYWGFTHMVEFVLPPIDGRHVTFNQKNPEILKLFRRNAKYLGGESAIDGIVPYLS